MATILIADDEQDLVDLVVYNLKREGHQPITALNGNEALEILRQQRPDAVVLDWMMPHKSGIQVLREIRERTEWSAIPVIMLTARGAVEDRVKGLEAGADDFVTKPFSPKELMLRIKGVLRRAAAGKGSVEAGPFLLDRQSLKLSLDGEDIDLTVTEFKLLQILIQNAGEVIGRDTLLREVWGYKDSTLTRTIDTHVKRLREKLGKHAPRLRTIRGHGYQLSPEGGDGSTS